MRNYTRGCSLAFGHITLPPTHMYILPHRTHACACIHMYAQYTPYTTYIIMLWGLRDGSVLWILPFSESLINFMAGRSQSVITTQCASSLIDRFLYICMGMVLIFVCSKFTPWNHCMMVRGGGVFDRWLCPQHGAPFLEFVLCVKGRRGGVLLH